MASWEVNEGVGRTVEFKGLKAHYLFLFAGGLLGIFILVVVLYLCGISQIICLGIGVVGATVVVWQTFAMNRKYGQYGLMKRGANHTLSSASKIKRCRLTAFSNILLGELGYYNK